MKRRLARLIALPLLLLAGCTTYYGDGYREPYYSDGGYYYPAEDGYGDYYAAPEYDYYDYGYSSYVPFWGLDRYGCGYWSSCSPYWNGYYGRPYSGWSLSFGSHWSYGYWGWYGSSWAPWYGYGGYYYRPPYYYDHDYDYDRPDRPEPPRPAGRPANPRPLYPEPMHSNAPRSQQGE